jgi:hypothetical protein
MVTLDRLGRYLTVQTNANGSYTIRDSSPRNHTNVVFAVTRSGMLGIALIPSIATGRSCNTIVRLRGGNTEIHVRDENCQPVADAEVRVYKSGIEDISFDLPPDICEVLKRQTNGAGIAQWPSRLGDWDLGIEVKAPGYSPQRRNYVGQDSRSIKVFVLDSTSRRSDRDCAEQIWRERNVDSTDVPRYQLGTKDDP